QHGAGSTQRQTGAVIFLRNERGEVARRGQRIHELGWIGRFVIELYPVGVGEVFADPPDTFADLLPVGVDWNRHRVPCALCHHFTSVLTGNPRPSVLSFNNRFPLPTHTVIPAEAGIHDTPADQVWKVAWMAASAAMTVGGDDRIPNVDDGSLDSLFCRAIHGFDGSNSASKPVQRPLKSGW